MKPIKLKIKGLNSFIDTQEIDFRDLTRLGLFGIFGPTGSGKSTILDGITLALYGAVARGSSNYINTNCETLNVSFEFQISEKEIKHYRVEREFRREAKTGNPRTRSAKIVQLTAESEMILAEQAGAVTAKCTEIIGLKLEDFTRTVVLPQGKFSEFLKLDGRERREMLERLFNLQKYGDELSSRLGNRIRKEREQANILEGELKTYTDCSDALLRERNEEANVIQTQCEQSREELITAEENFTSGKQVWDLQTELLEQVKQKNELEKNEREVKDSETKVTAAESALKVKPFIDRYEETLVQISATQEELTALEQSMEALTISKKNAETASEFAGIRKDRELPELRMREQKALEAIAEKKKLDGLLADKNLLQKDMHNLEKALEGNFKQERVIAEQIMTVNADIMAKETAIESLFIAEDYKKKIQDALLVLSQYDNAEKQRSNASEELETLSSGIQTAQAQAEKLTEKLEANETLQLSRSESLQQLIANCPGDQDTLLALKEQGITVKEKWSKYHEYNELIQKSRETVEILNQELARTRPEAAVLEQDIQRIEQEIRTIETENIAHILRDALREGDACPVCGAKEHPIAAREFFDPSRLERLKQDLNEQKNKLDPLTISIIEAQGTQKLQEKSLQEHQEKIKELGEEFKAFSLENLRSEFDQSRADINRYNTQKAKLEKILKDIGEERNTLRLHLTTETTKKAANESQREKRQQDFDTAQAAVSIAEQELAKLRSELGVEDFKQTRAEISAKEQQKADLETLLKKLREEVKGSQSQKEMLTADSAKMSADLSGMRTGFEEKDKAILEKIESIQAKVGRVEDLEVYRKTLTDAIIQIGLEYETAETNKNEVDRQYNECHTRQRSAQDSLSNLTLRSFNDKVLLDKALAEEHLPDSNTAKSLLLTKAEIDELKTKIGNYRTQLANITGLIENLNQKLANRSISEEQWVEVQRLKDEHVERLKALETKKIELAAFIANLARRLEEKNKRLKAKQELDRQLSLLDDLEKLFKGKKFIEFVAAHQLKYVSLEADKRLKEISGGNFGLEVDENGKFLIRDYKNGGAQRDASTLSGGETFLTSLALALALSAQIQLKGTAPLELFFLDEGFGTLDDDLLEVVMDSLEKIHHPRLSVGIISHVEAIKNRVPIKLMLTPAKPGMGGSKVTLDTN